MRLPFTLLAILAFGSPSAAQVLPDAPELDAQLFRPAFDSRSTLWTESAGVRARELDGVGRVFLNYVNNPLVWVDPRGADDVRIVGDALALNALGAVSYDRFRLGVDIPVYLVAASELDLSGAGIGDISVDGRVTGLDRRTDPLGVGLSGRLTLPTSTLQTSLGASAVVGQVTLLVDKDVGNATFAANVGTRFTPALELDNIKVGNQFVYKAGAGYALGESGAGLSVEAGGQVEYSEPLVNPAGAPLEALVGGWYRLNNDWVLRGGVGRGLTSGIGSPSARAIVALAFERPLEGDADGDGFFDLVDACADEPEDFDSFEDEDGCPDPDNDKDGVADADDQCPLEPEDADNFADDDGCPDPSSDVRFLVLGPDDQPLTGAKITISGPEEASGAHGLTAKLHEGEYTAEATAPYYAATSVTFHAPGQDEVVLNMGAVPGTLAIEAYDPDGALIPGATYTLSGKKGEPLQDGTIEAEAPSGEHLVVVRADGYAPYKESILLEAEGTLSVVAVLKPTKVKVSRDKIDIKDKVFFDTNKASIKSVSFELLDEVAQIIVDYPEIRMIRIEGHTDSRGSESANQKLSDERAASVMDYLVEQGVEASRLNSIGYGESKPLDPSNTSAAHEKNRRVEFFVEEWDADMAPER